jgi:molybdopterin converting factor small subunit
MMSLKIPTPLRYYTNGQVEVFVSGRTVSEVLTDLIVQYPALEPHLFSGGGEMHPSVNFFISEHHIKSLQGLSTPIKEGDRIMLILSIAGGRHA